MDCATEGLLSVASTVGLAFQPIDVTRLRVKSATPRLLTKRLWDP